MATPGFYLGRTYDLAKAKLLEEQVNYDPDDLTTHALVVGMTGSGKTGLCVDLLEEAALAGIPALMIDPKGDITNLLLHFPGLAPSDFRPWVDPEQARRDGKSLDQAAAEAAAWWEKGLAEWGIGRERIAALTKAADFAVYTPGSSAGLPVSILASLAAPALDWNQNREVLRERIADTVTALLGLVGLKDIDPVRSREHILLANIFEQAWSQKRDLTLPELITQTQSPPFAKLGVFEVNTFFPEKERFGLAMSLNAILASPSFQSWTEGEPLDVGRMLFTADGRPRHSIFYIAHLSDSERMFFVTLLFNAIEGWMRTQAGSSSLRAIVYFDEIQGFLPPVAVPSSKPPMLRMLKMARAFGVGLLLATQNPVDLDYKGLANTGTWFLGRLQTDQDKQRLLDGLQGAAPGIDRGEYDRMLSGLGKRVFLLHNVHAKKPAVFQTRWAMNYLPGPLTREQIPVLNALVGAKATPMAAPPAPTAAARMTSAAPAAAAIPASGAGRPIVPSGVSEFFFPNNLTLVEAARAAGNPQAASLVAAGMIYRPALVAQAQARILDRKNGIDLQIPRSVMVVQPDPRGMIRWDDFAAPPLDPATLASSGMQAAFAALEAPLANGKMMASLQKDFEDWVYRATKVGMRSNTALKLTAGPQVGEEEFRRRCLEAAERAKSEELAKLDATYVKKIDAARGKLGREELELEQDKADLSARKTEEAVSGLSTVIGVLGRGIKGIPRALGSSRLSSPLTKRRLTQTAKADVEESVQAIGSLKSQLEALEGEKAQTAEALSAKWNAAAQEISQTSLTPLKKDVFVDVFGVAWLPYYQVSAGGQSFELPGFKAG